MSIRTEKVASVVKKALSEPLRELSQGVARGSLVTLTTVRMTNDLSIARVYLSIYGGKLSPLEVIHKMDDNKVELRHQMAKKIRLKSTPDLEFYLDDTLDQMDDIQKLIDSTKNDDQEE